MICSNTFAESPVLPAIVPANPENRTANSFSSSFDNPNVRAELSPSFRMSFAALPYETRTALIDSSRLDASAIAPFRNPAAEIPANAAPTSGTSRFIAGANPAVMPDPAALPASRPARRPVCASGPDT